MAITLDGTNGIETPAINAGNIVGEVAFFALDTPPTGWLKANGAAVSRSTYADLFAAIGTTYGAGDGSTTFALPDLRGEFPRGWDDGRGVDSGRSFGTAQGDALRSHRHGIRASASGGFSDVNDGFRRGSAAIDNVFFNTFFFGGAETRPRNVALLACIKF